MKLRHTWATILLAGMVLCHATAARADGLIRDGVGPISTGRGGTNQGFADNSAIILDNPAAMINVAGTGLAEVGVDTVIVTADYTDSYGNDVYGKVRPLPAPVLGIIKKSPNEQWAFGLGAFAPAGFGASYGVLDNPIFGPSLTRSLGAMGKLLPAIAYRATDRLALGLSVGIGFSYASLDGPLFLQSGALTGVPALLDAEGTGVAPVGSFGIQYQLTPQTMIGATYTEQSNFWLHGATNATLFTGAFAESRFNSKIHLRWPRSVAVGFKHDLCPHRRISADMIWFDWAHAFSDIGFVLYDASNPAFQGLTPVTQNLPLNWRNSISMRLGYETDLSDVDRLRFGYSYHPSPSPNSTLNPYIDGVLVNAFSIGYSRRARRVILNAAYQYTFGATRHVGTSSLVGGQFDNSTFRADAHFAMFSLLFPY